MHWTLSVLPLMALFSCLHATAWAGESAGMRAPAVPLVVHDPYFSIWSCHDQLSADWPRHWTGAIHALASMVRIDGKAYRLMGTMPQDVPPLPQTACVVLPTRTRYSFQGQGVAVQLTFTTPALPDDLDVLSRPVTYLDWQVRSTDGKPHEVAIYYDNSAELVVDKPDQEVAWSRPKIAGLDVLRMGSREQPVLEKKGDNLRIDWGHLYVAIPGAQRAAAAIASHEGARLGFARTGKLPADDSRQPRKANEDWPVLAAAFDLGRVEAAPATRWLMLAYDDEYSIEYLGQKLRPWWRRGGLDAAGLLAKAAAERSVIGNRCEEFDARRMAELQRAGGPRYAQFCAIAYRQAIGAHKLAAGPTGQPMLFSKENFSNGCIATVDVLYPGAPIFAWLSNDLLKATVTPVFDYAASGRWKFPFAPHDLGTYPKANGQVYGGGEKTEENQMPVEESGNMLIVAALIAQLDGNADYLKPYWKPLSQWADYLKQKGLDPENQLCTDDFAGHLAHNANLSLKAIVALACYSRLAEMTGRADLALQYRKLAESYAKQWVKLADDGDHFRLAFDRPGTWSQKYNLVWDKLLGLKLFPPEIARKELAYYKTRLNPYGLPLDNRAVYTKTDWEVWTATLADNRAEFDALMAPVYRFVSHTEPRVPMTDWYMTDTARKRGFQARSVIGGVFIKMLEDLPALKGKR